MPRRRGHAPGLADTGDVDMTDATKLCRKCGERKPREAFNRKTVSPDGLQPACRECVSAYNHQLYTRDPAKVRARNDAWAAANPEKTRAYARAKQARTWAARPEQMRAYHRSYYELNPDRRRLAIRECARRRRAADPVGNREYLAKWRAENRDKVSAMNRRRRARKAAVLTIPFTVEQLAARLSMWPGCWMCGGAKETIDHVKPLSKSGAHILGNLRPACRSCNASKRETWPYVRAA
jgi:5-methylcytosine-specific restriction endonuclease McrA